MGKHSYDMSKESERLDMELKDGVYKFEIVSIEEKVSSQQNDMLVMQVALDSDPSQGSTVYMVTQEGKRWFLKQLLEACGITQNQEGNYDFDTDELIGKLVEAKVVNVNDEWVDRNGATQSKMKSKIVKFINAKP